MRCEDFEPIVEGVADGTLDPGAEAHAHIAACRLCTRRLEEARAIHELLSMREVPVPPAAFTARVMTLVQRQRWQAERAIDIGFNLAVAAGVVLILGGGAGLAWSMGFFEVQVDFDLLLRAASTRLSGAVLPQVQTVAVSALLLAMTLVLWWWAEADATAD